MGFEDQTSLRRRQAAGRDGSVYDARQGADGSVALSGEDGKMVANAPGEMLTQQFAAMARVLARLNDVESIDVRFYAEEAEENRQ